jgi:adenylate cyclase
MQCVINEPQCAPRETIPGRALILVVDDEEQNRTLLKDPLEAKGFDVMEAEDGAAALRSIAQRPPDVILLDLMMPGMDGFELCRRLKNDAKTAPIPVLMVTALSDRKERLMGIEAGANDFLNKPVDIQDLLLRVANAADAKNLFDQLKAEREKSDKLLLNILPAPVARRMKAGELTIADKFDEVTVLVVDLAGFTHLASHIPAEQVVFLLDEIFSSFDQLLERHGVEKIKTMGDAYMAACGVPERRDNAAESILNLALDITGAFNRFNEQYQTSLRLRIGIGTGPAVAGVIGRKKFSYDLWGDVVNVACRLESICEPGNVLVDAPTFELVKAKFNFGVSTAVHLKGRGETITYLFKGHL